MLIKSSIVNTAYKLVDDIKQEYISYQDNFKSNFSEPTILDLPQNAPVEVPRIFMKSKGEHTQISIAPAASCMQIQYTDEYVKAWELCERYLKSRADDLFGFIDVVAHNNYKYLGVITNIVWNDVSNEGQKNLYKNLFGKEAPKALDDLVVKYTYVEEDSYYVNITLQSSQMYEECEEDSAGMFSNEKLKAHTVIVVLDINDRYSYNKKEGYVSNKDVYDSLLKITSDIIVNKIQTLIETGEYRND